MRRRHTCCLSLEGQRRLPLDLIVPPMMRRGGGRACLLLLQPIHGSNSIFNCTGDTYVIFIIPLFIVSSATILSTLRPTTLGLGPLTATVQHNDDEQNPLFAFPPRSRPGIRSILLFHKNNQFIIIISYYTKQITATSNDGNSITITIDYGTIRTQMEFQLGTFAVGT